MLSECRKENLEIVLPTRRQNLKLPGMILRGNPKKYMTKLIAPIKDARQP